MCKKIMKVVKFIATIVCFVLAHRCFEQEFLTDNSLKELLYGAGGILLLIPYYKLIFKWYK